MTLTVCWGAGWDSTAMLIEMHRRGIRPDLITFADVGAEKPGTYRFLPLFSQWCRDHDFPDPTICVYQPKEVTTTRYRAGVEDVAARLGITLDEQQIARLSRIYGNMVANETLPGLAFGMKSCSLKWKVEAQEPPRCVSAPLVAAWDRGERVMKAIGFDCTEDHRTFADGKGMNISPCKGLPRYADRYSVWYPLRDWGLDRDACGRIITDAGLPLPPKSACFFCPAMKPVEIELLRRDEPDCYALAIEMERLYRGGRHYRGDDTWTVAATHKITRETTSFDCTAASAAEARQKFRYMMKDTARPYQWNAAPSSAVPGLGRNFSWQDRELESIPE